MIVALKLGQEICGLIRADFNAVSPKNIWLTIFAL